MLSKAARAFILQVTNYFDGHWEDPDWGRAPINQVLVGLTLRELANGLQDAEARSQIHAAADRAIAKMARA